VTRSGVKAKSAKDLLGPLVERNADLARVGNVVVLKPIRHVLGGICIEPGNTPERFLPTWFVHHLLVPHRGAVAEKGIEACGDRRDDWAFSRPNVEQDLAQALEHSVLPILRGVQELEAMVNLRAAMCAYDRRNYRFYGLRTGGDFITKIALGQIDVALLWAKNIRISGYLDRRLQDDAEPCEGELSYLDWIRRVLVLLEQDGRAGMAEMLHAWEAETVRLLKLEHLWEPTPFPLEEAD
jgi:hypothetical protein